MFARIGDTDFVAKEIAYHAICRTSYQTRADQVKKSKPEKFRAGIDRGKFMRKYFNEYVI